MTESMDAMTRTPDDKAFPAFRSALEGIGLSLDIRGGNPASCAGVVFHGKEELARFSFRGTNGQYEFSIHPLDPFSLETIAHGRGRHVDDLDGRWLSEQVSLIEELLRAKLVHSGDLDASEFPSDYSLRRWVAFAGTIALPKERTVRNVAGTGIAVRPDELPGHRFPSKGAETRELVAECRKLARAFERERALALALAWASNPSPHGDPTDPASGYLVKTARGVLRGRLRDMSLAWEGKSLARALTGLQGERDDATIPYSTGADSPSP